MNRLKLFFAGLGVVLTLSSAQAQSEWQPLFNGKDLTGWRANNQPGAWSASDGVLRGHATTTEMSHLFFVGSQPEGTFETFTNFVLELSARSETNANSGIFFHTDYETMGSDKRLRNGYEVQLNSTAKEKRKTGSLYAVVDLAESPVAESQWFRLRLTVRGQHITIELNDKMVVDYTEPPNVQRPSERAGRKLNPQGGAIALQAHDPGSTFFFKDIRIKRLP
jgi:hypothetical protein